MSKSILEEIEETGELLGEETEIKNITKEEE